MPDIGANIESVRQRVGTACKRAGRDLSDVSILAAVKGVPLNLIEDAIHNGITELGENRVQEAQARASGLRSKYPGTVWHMIGHLQTNKVKQALEIFDIIETVDTEYLADELDKRCEVKGKRCEVLVEVNLSGEGQKFGVPETEAESLIRHVAGKKNLKVSGLITVPPFSGDSETSRPYFKELAALKDRINALKIPGVKLTHLSMGMSDDFEVAVEEGATIVRIGRGIFGIEHKY